MFSVVFSASNNVSVVDRYTLSYTHYVPYVRPHGHRGRGAPCSARLGSGVSSMSQCTPEAHPPALRKGPALVPAHPGAGFLEARHGWQCISLHDPSRTEAGGWGLKRTGL